MADLQVGPNPVTPVAKAQAANPSLVEGTVNPLTTDLTGALRVKATIGTVSVSSDATATAAAPSYTEGTANPVSQNLTGDTRVIAKLDQTTPGTTNGVVVNSGTLTAVTAITNALPAGENHVGEVGGHAVVWQAADAAITRPNNATAYAAHQGIGDAGNCIFKFTNFFRKNGGTGLLTGIRIVVNKASIATSNMGNVRAHLFNASPSSPPAADQATWQSLVANAGSKLGVVDFATWNIGGTGSDIIDSYGVPILNNLPLVADATHKDLYVVLEATAAFTPIASAIITPYVAAVED